MKSKDNLSLIILIFIIGMVIVVSAFTTQIDTIEEQTEVLDENKYSEIIFSEQIIEIPVNFILVKDSSAGPYESRRDLADLKRIERNVNRIWSQAYIRFNISFSELEAEEKLIDNALNGDLLELNELQTHAGSDLTVLFVGKLRANGIAYTNTSLSFVNDFTTVNDYRAVSHELGHHLGLVHNFESTNNLMSQGVNGENLTQKEIEIARKIFLAKN